jgi:putative membrane protein
MSFLSHLRVALVGFVMGIADLIPGVSGGTIAFICGIYDRFINGLKTFDIGLVRAVLAGRWREAWDRVPVFFFLALGIGLVTAIFTLSGVLSGLFLTHPVELWSLFFGLILGSIVLLARETWPWKPSHFAAFILATVATFILVGLPLLQIPPSKPFLFLAGAIAICAMILPGISGSYLLVIMGQYGVVLEALDNRDFASLAIFVSGIAVGVLSFVRIVSWFLRHHRQITLVALTGVMAGALRTVWPWKETVTTRVNSQGLEVPLQQINIAPPDGANLLIPAALALAGAVVVLGLSRLAPKAGRE